MGHVRVGCYKPFWRLGVPYKIVTGSGRSAEVPPARFVPLLISSFLFGRKRTYNRSFLRFLEV